MTVPTPTEVVTQIAAALSAMPLADQVQFMNTLRRGLSAIGPFADEPVDCVMWVHAGEVTANDYNPNAVAPPEMELLRLSIEADGYTQPIVANREESSYVVVDGFHRHRVGRECNEVRERLHGYLPVVQIRESQTGRPDRIASTVRHNRARGKHQVMKMSDIVLELKRRNWSDKKIAEQLGMDADEVLRLAQITGLAEAFKDREFSEAWEADIEPDDLVDNEAGLR
jgi:ParB-like chromosome segregation protein Spo0J